MKLSVKQKRQLINIASWSIQSSFDKDKRGQIPSEYLDREIIEFKAGAFVSVYVLKALRGCIGTFSETDRLVDNIRRMSQMAAFEDDRFKSLEEKEIQSMTLEISVLTPRTPIKDPSQIEIGRHGIYMIHGGRRATFLPQVAKTQNWNRIEFLENCAESKLGLWKDAWKEAELFTYEALVFSSSDPELR